MKLKYKYFQVVSSDGTVHFSSYDRADARWELHVLRYDSTLKEEGYKGFKVTYILTDEKPDLTVYGKNFKPFTTAVSA